MKGFAVFLFLGAVCFPLAAEDVILDRVPVSVEDFIALRAELALTPEGGAALLVSAMLAWGVDRDLGRTFFILSLVNDGSMLRSASSGYKGYDLGNSAQFLVQQLNARPYIAPSYIRGTSPGNGYALPPRPWTLVITRNPYSEQADGSVKVFVASSGADSPRPIRLVKNSAGLWKVAEFSSLVVDIRKPAAAVTDDL